MSRSRADIQEEQRRLKKEFGNLYDDVLALLFRYDPIGINFEDNVDEYSPEVGTILPRLKECRGEDDVRRIVHEEFTRWFGEAGTPEKYSDIGPEIWRLWQRFHDA